MFNILLILIFARPFIPSVIEFSFSNAIYSSLLLVFLMVWIFLKGLPIEKTGPIKYPLIVFCASLLISSIFSYNKTVSINELYKYLTALLLFLIATSLSIEQKSMLIKGIIVSAIFVSFLSIYQYFFGFKHLSEYIARNNITDQFILDYVSRKRVFSPFVTPSVLGGYLAMIIPLTLIDKKKLWCIIPLSFALLLTRSVGAIFSLFLGLTVYFCLIERLGKKRGTPGFRIIYNGFADFNRKICYSKRIYAPCFFYFDEVELLEGYTWDNQAIAFIRCGDRKL